MKIPLDWLKEYIDLRNLTPQEIGEAFTQLGLMLDKPFDGKVFDLEHRFDRADWLSILGCARDLCAFLGKDLNLPPTYKEAGKKPQQDQLVDIKVACPDVVNRFNTRVFRNIKVEPSPDWLKRRLEEYGIPSINNVVDITNYVMVELGQPMHAQDLAKFRKNSSGGKEIVIRKAKSEEKIVTFLGDELTLYPEAFVLTQDGVATVLGGIVGGRETGVDEKTTDIIVDAGNYNQTVIRKVSRKLKIQNETVLRYDKFLHPNLTQYAIERATRLIMELAGGEYYQNIDWNPMESKTKEMTLRSKRLANLAGFEIGFDKVMDILTRLDYTIIPRKDAHQNSDWEIQLTVPYFRTDIEVEDDIVSDILRINGYSKIPTAQIQSAPPKEVTPEIYKFEETLRDALIQLGAHEHITDPLVSRTDNPVANQIVLENSQNSQKDALRTSIYQTLQTIVPNYTKNQISNGVLFEVGKVYNQTDDIKNYTSYQEIRVLECLLFDKTKAPKDLHNQTSSTLTGLFKALGLKNISLVKINLQEAQITQGDKILGSVRYDGFTLFTESLLASPRHTQRIISDIQVSSSTDLSLTIPKDVSLGMVLDFLATTDGIKKVDFVEEYVEDKRADNRRSVLLKIVWDSTTDVRTTNTHLTKCLTSLEHKYDIKIRR